MKKLYLVVLTTLLATMQLLAQTWQWTNPEPNGNLINNQEHDDAHDVEVDASGNAYVLGDYLGSLFLNDSLRATGSGSYLAKYDSSGVLLWYRLIMPTSSSGGYIGATDLTVTTQGIFIAGRYSPTYISTYTYSIGSFNFVSGGQNVGVFVTKFTVDGTVAWNNLVTGAPAINYSAYKPLITSDKNNNIIFQFLYGGYNSSLSFGSGTIPVPTTSLGYPLLVCKMNDAGTLLWSNYAANYSFNYVSNDCNSMITDNNGNIFLYGLANDGCEFGSNTFHTSEFIKNGNKSWSTFIAKISSSGVWEFAKDLINTNYSQGITLGHTFLAVDNAANVYALANYKGNSYGSSAIILGDTVTTDKTKTYLVKMDNNGNLIWHKGFGSNETSANSIHFANNTLYISGSLRNNLNLGKLWYFSDLYVNPSSPNYGGAFEYFVSKANTNGDFQWVTSFSSPYNTMEGFAVKAFNNQVYTSGYYRGNISSLGHLNGIYSAPFDGSKHNLFFGKLKDQYIRVGTLSAKQVMPGCSINIPFTSTGLTFSAKNKFTAELSNTIGDFTTPTVIGSVKSTGRGVIKATIPATLAYGSSGYRIRIRSSDTLLTGYNYFAYADTGYALTVTCPGVASGLNTSNITGITATLNWQTVGCAAGYKLQYRVKGTIAWTTQNTSSTATSLAIAGLTPNTLYQWRIATKCNNNGVNSFSAYSPIQQFKTAVASAVAANINAASQTANALQIAILPNPAKTSALLTINGPVTNATITITDFVGKIIWKQHGINSHQVVLPLQNFAAGMYLVTLHNSSETSIVKLVKE